MRKEGKIRFGQTVSIKSADDERDDEKMMRMNEERMNEERLPMNARGVCNWNMVFSC